MLNKKPKRALIHYSTADISAFSGDTGRFKVRTQGRVYTLDLDTDKHSSITRFVTPKCALLFTDAAAEKFKPHTLKTISFYKRFLGQYRSRAFGDVTWKKEDTVAHGKVLQIRDIEFVTIDSRFRRHWQQFKVYAAISGNICLALLFFSSLTLTTMRRFFPGELTSTLGYYARQAFNQLEPLDRWLSANAPALFISLAILIALLFGVSNYTLKKVSFADDLEALGFSSKTKAPQPPPDS
ncbi:hypothetical protein [Pseudomonas huaxiensis]|uniref:hypothetical protein n=1 Tax=Pseudomonas huaxiensis TaxID=2213017 RepID=UPI000DA652D0|nr:hypothetical protein [Pseudomonas huaxiensis]